MGRSTVTNDMKIQILQRINENREILLSEQSPKLPRMEQNLAWKDVWLFAKSIGAVFTDWKHLKKQWHNWKANSKKRSRKANQTGAGTKGLEVTQADQIIYDIIEGAANTTRAKVSYL